MVIRKVIDGKDIADKRQQPCHERPALRFRHLTGELVLHDFMQDVVPGIVESLQQLRHRQFLRAVGGIAFQAEGRGFEPRLPLLERIDNQKVINPFLLYEFFGKPFHYTINYIIVGLLLFPKKQ